MCVMALPTKQQALQAYRQHHNSQGLPEPWLMVDFELWWKADTQKVCAIQIAGRKGEGRCNKPCLFCLSKLRANENVHDQST